MSEGVFKLDGIVFVFVTNLFDDRFDMGFSGPWDGSNDVHKEFVFGLFFSTFFEGSNDQFSLVVLSLKIQIVTSAVSSEHACHGSKQMLSKLEKLKNFGNF